MTSILPFLSSGILHSLVVTHSPEWGNLRLTHNGSYLSCGDGGWVSRGNRGGYCSWDHGAHSWHGGRCLDWRWGGHHSAGGYLTAGVITIRGHYTAWVQFVRWTSVKAGIDVLAGIVTSTFLDTSLIPGISLFVGHSLVHTDRIGVGCWCGVDIRARCGLSRERAGGHWWGDRGSLCLVVTQGLFTTEVVGVLYKGTVWWQGWVGCTPVCTLVFASHSILTDTIVGASILPSLSLNVLNSLVHTNISGCWSWHGFGGGSSHRHWGWGGSGRRLGVSCDHTHWHICDQFWSHGGSVRSWGRSGESVWSRNTRGNFAALWVIGISHKNTVLWYAVIFATSILASVKSSASILTPADSITAIIPLLSLSVGAAIHGTDVFRLWSWCWSCWVGIRCRIRVWIGIRVRIR